ncbi:MAG: hypothetical protein DMG26_08590 [Acidobacteria bacterium]|nr:MAG: hypothetical protein DMG26_08590 [Acidobacteriota bacterium]
MNDQHSAENQTLSVAEYIRRTFVPISHLSHDWEMHSAVPRTPAEERTMVREPAQAVPATVAKRLGSLRVLVVPYVSCSGTGDRVCFSKPKGGATLRRRAAAADHRHVL